MQLDQRDANRRNLLTNIRRASQIARIDLAQRTGISQASVTTITAELIRDGLIEEVPREPTAPGSRRGRPRVDLRIRAAAHTVAGMKVTERTVSTVLLDFEGCQIGEHTFPLPAPDFAPDGFAEVLHAALEAAAAEAGIACDTISGIGIGLAGTVEASSNLVHWSPHLTQRNVPLGALLQKRFSAPVFLDNDANLVAMAELYFGHGREVSDFLVVTIESGVGLGIVLGNEIYRGSRGCGAEFGHTKIQLDGALCRCGQRGCLEAYVADYALLREAGHEDAFATWGAQDHRMKTLIDAARGGDARAADIVDRAGRIFALGLANLVNIFDPQLIILSGERMQFDYLYAEEVMEAMRGSIIQIDMPPPEVVIHRWGNHMWAKGAAAYAIDRVAEIALRDMSDNAA
ncbi:MAG: ROK family transcriptional regulator [Celeribacter sp.]|jgi:predicted NBD/HSP70 family sugar kinase